VKVAYLMVTTAELPAKDVTAYTADGRTVSTEKLTTLLAKERPVLVVTDGKKVDPFLLQLYKDDVLVLVPPVSTFQMGFGDFSGIGATGGYGGFGGDRPPPAYVVPEGSRPPRDLPLKKPVDERRN
jgi:hypothetical protein